MCVRVVRFRGGGGRDARRQRRSTKHPSRQGKAGILEHGFGHLTNIACSARVTIAAPPPHPLSRREAARRQGKEISRKNKILGPLTALVLMSLNEVRHSESDEYFSATVCSGCANYV